ncbi:MAG: GspH/FimT family pseudopilin [Pseudomonadota bacterium]
MKKLPSKGFNILELMVTVVVVGILASVAFPMLSSVVRSARITSNANNLVAGLQLARSEAVKRRAIVRVCRTDQANDAVPECGSGNGWESGWIVYVDTGGDGAFDDGADTIVRRTDAFEGNRETPTVFVTIVGGGTVADEIAYDPNGFPVVGNIGAGGSALVFCDDRQLDAAGRALLISPTGRPNVRPLDESPFPNLSCSTG